MIQNTNIKVSLTPELRLEQALKEAGIEDPATVAQLTVSGTFTNDDFKYIREEMWETLQGLDMGNAKVKGNKIEDVTFYCERLVFIIIPDLTTEIESFAFLGCNALTSIMIHPENPYLASHDGIMYNKDKTELIFCPQGKQDDCVISNSVVKIGDCAFDDCNGVDNIFIPASVIEIGWNVFSGQYITVHPDNPAYTSDEGILFSKDKKELIAYPRKRQGDYQIPDSVEKIGFEAFSGCSGLTSIAIPDSVTEIGAYAFFACEGLTSVIIPDSVKVIQSMAFYGCTSLKSVFIPASAVKISLTNLFSCPANITVHPDNPKYTSKNGKLKRKKISHTIKNINQ